MEQTRINYLAKQYIHGLANAEEKAAFLSWVREENNDALVREILGTQWKEYDNPAPLPADQGNRLFQSVLDAAKLLQEDEEAQAPVRTIIHWQRWVAAASIIFMLGLVSYFIFFNKTKQTEIAKTQDERFNNDIAAPKDNRATITLSDGTIVSLDSTANGQLATQSNVVVTKTADGKIIYAVIPTQEGSDTKYNTLLNPRGSKVIDITLSDGSKVWLNAGSSITYPVAFISNERKITMTGEAYFEIAHNKSKPFIVSANNKADVIVLGTHFNVNAYEDESDIKVTLLEGSVKVGSSLRGTKQSILKPGQQARASMDGGLSTVDGIDLEETLAWKNGRFYFDGSDIKTIMKQVERWYNVEVLYENNSNELFVAKISRDVPLSEMLKLLELTNLVHFKIEGKRVTVMR